MKRLILMATCLLLALPWGAQAQVSLQEDSPLRYGAPDTGHLIRHRGYALSYDGRLRSARWVAERLTTESLADGVDRKDEFRLDPFVPPEFRAERADYEGSGFDQGHLAPSANHTGSRLDNSATFFLSNMSPQVGRGFNQGYWRHLEASIRDLLKREEVREVYVFTGPLFMPDTLLEQGSAHDSLTVTYRFIGPNHVPVPTHYFKAVLAVCGPSRSTACDRSHRLRLWAYVLPNAPIDNSTPIDDFAVTTDFLEHWAGFDLWSALAEDIERDLESKKARPWPGSSLAQAD